jgi:benzoyl-CoA reductase subunit D
MITAGIDIGVEYTKVVILKDGEVLARRSAPSGGKGRGQTADTLWIEALDRAGIRAQEVACIVAAGAGKYDVPFANDTTVEELADARAARQILATATSVVDAGADQTRVVSLAPDGSVAEIVRNQKCMAGLGLALEYLADRLDYSIEEISGIAAGAADGTVVNDGCPVFAELDALELLNKGVPREKVAAAVTEAVVVRLNSILHDKVVPAAKTTVLIGGLARNTAVVEALKARSGIDFIVPEEPEYGTALGAALLAADEAAAQN